MQTTAGPRAPTRRHRSAAGTLVPNLALVVPPRPQVGGRTHRFRLAPDRRYGTGRRVRASDFRRGLEVAVRDGGVLASYLDALPGVRREFATLAAFADIAVALVNEEAETLT